MDSATIIALASFVTAKVCALLALWLRLRWRARGERLRRQCVLDITKAVIPGTRLELDDRIGSGHQLRLKIVHASAHEGNPAE